MKNEITLGERQYPNLLKEIYSPPQKIFCKGNLSILRKTCICIVGTRRSSEYGAYIVEKIVEDLSVLDIAIVSGLAKGIDTLAHKAALKNNISTIAVLGSGIDNIYPRENRLLAQEISENNLIISEYESYAPPLKHQFPMRNRIISGLSVATIVVEAPEKSGALITAQFALEQGREVFVVPGDIDRENSKGTLRLLQNSSAYPISSGKEVIDLLKEQPHLFQPSPTKTLKKNLSLPYNLTAQEKQILSLLSTSRSTSADTLCQTTRLSIPDTLTTLSLLEIQGLITAKNGNYLKKRQ